MKHLDLFSGIGGFALACKWIWGNNYENIGHSEIEDYPCQVYHKNFPESKCLGDITKINYAEGQADLITGGFPCQPHSNAGLRRASEDERDLWGECLRALCGIRPEYALFENVPGLLSSDNGRFLNRILADLASIGYNAEWEVISACALGAPHTRERLWIITYPYGERQLVLRNLYSGSEKEYRIRRAWQFTISNERDLRGKRRFRTEPTIPRVANGIPFRMDRIKSLGNAIVPQVAYQILKGIKEYDRI